MGLKSPKHEYFYQGNSSKPYPGPKRKKLEIFVFAQISSFLDRLDKNSPEWPKMASQTHRNGPPMLQKLQISDF